MHGAVFFLRGDPASNMALRFIDIQHLPHLLIQLWIHPAQALRHVHMYGRLTDTKFLCCRTDSCFVLNDIFAELYGPFFHNTLQDEPLRFPLK